MSGLKMNTEKTSEKTVQRKIKYSNNKLQVNSQLEWGITEFIPLGITFNVLKKRYLTPFGNISVIKTFIMTTLEEYTRHYSANQSDCSI